MNHYKPILAIDGFVVGAGITLQYFTIIIYMDTVLRTSWPEDLNSQPNCRLRQTWNLFHLRQPSRRLLAGAFS
jgi:hypothetical protein